MSTKTYKNKTLEMQYVEFVDGDGYFLMKGQSITSDKEVKTMSKGVTIVDGDASVLGKASK